MVNSSIVTERPLLISVAMYYGFRWCVTVLVCRAGRLHAAGGGAAAGPREGGERAARARLQGQGAAARPPHRRQEGRRQVGRAAAAERAEQRRHPDQGQPHPSTPSLSPSLTNIVQQNVHNIRNVKIKMKMNIRNIFHHIYFTLYYVPYILCFKFI